MNQLIFLLILGCLLFLFSLFALLHAPPRNNTTPEAMEALSRIISLPGLDFLYAGFLFQESDYRWILRETGQRSVAQQLRRDRRRLALFWLKQLQIDVLALWRFRRLLTTVGIPSSIREEAGVAGKAVAVLFLLLGLRLFVALFGPFFFGRMAAGIQSGVQHLSRGCGATLGRVPMCKLAELEEYWRSLETAHVSS
jgi:hypothetical protein